MIKHKRIMSKVDEMLFDVQVMMVAAKLAHYEVFVPDEKRAVELAEIIGEDTELAKVAASRWHGYSQDFNDRIINRLKQYINETNYKSNKG